MPYSEEAQRFLDLAKENRERLTPEIRARMVLRDLEEWESKIFPEANSSLFLDLLNSLGPGGQFEDCSGDEARAGFMTEGGEAMQNLWFSAVVYASDAIKQHRAGETIRAWDSVVEAAQMNAILTGILAERGDADAKRKIESRTRGSKGGKKGKKLPWATETAKRLFGTARGKTNDQAWGMLPSSSDPWEIDTPAKEYRVYVDGDSLCCDGTTRSIKKETFFSEYYRPLKTTRK